MNRDQNPLSFPPGKTRILLFGPTSVTGFALAQRYGDRLSPVCFPQNRPPEGRSWIRLDPSDPQGIARDLARLGSDIVIYCHAVCDVEKCERDPAWARHVNVDTLSRILDRIPQNCRMVYVSSDHVFGQDGGYTESSAPCPISAYGRTRVQAEDRVLSRPGSLVIRTGLPLGPSVDGRSGHVDWLRYRMVRGLPVTIVQDEARSVVWAEDLAERIVRLAVSSITGIRHVPATRPLSRPALARLLVGALNLPEGLSFDERRNQAAPHIGRIELLTNHADCFSRPLPSPADRLSLRHFSQSKSVVPWSPDGPLRKDPLHSW